MTNSTHRVHDRTGGPSAFKTKVVLEALKGVKTLARLHRQPGQSDFGIYAQQITDWKRQVLDGIPGIFESPVSKPGRTIGQREQIESPLFQ